MFDSKALKKLLIPLMIEQLLNVLVGMVDVLMVAVLGETAVSGVSLVDSMNILIFQILSAMATGGAVVCAQYIGAGKKQKVSRAAGQLVLVTLVISSGICMICLVWGKELLRLIFGSVEEAVFDNARRYFFLTALSYPFLALYNSSAALFRSAGNSRVSMVTSLIMNGMNVAGNALCIFGLHMGVEGVAIPTLGSRIFAAVLMMGLLQKPENPYRIHGLPDLKPDGGMIRRILSIGIPSGLENGMFQFGKLMLQSLVSGLGTASIAGYAVAHNLATFLYLPGNALGMGMITIVGQCVGAGAYEEAKEYAKKLVRLNYTILLFLAAGMALGRGFLVQLYNLSPEASAIGSYMFLTHCIAMVIWPPAFCLPNAFRAAGDIRFTMFASVLIMWIFRVGGAYVFVKGLGFGAEGVWYAMYIDWIARIVVYGLHFRGYTARLEKKDLMDERKTKKVQN